jgi:hypothetical protein
LKGQSQVIDAFIQACTADNQPLRSQAKRIALLALKWASDPLVVVSQDSKAIAGGQVVDACGFHHHLLGVNQLEITHTWFEAYEFGSNYDRPKNADRLTRTLLHETVHWVRDTAGASDQIEPATFKGSREEAGHFFEQLAFGTNNICLDTELEDAMFSIRVPGQRPQVVR